MTLCHIIEKELKRIKKVAALKKAPDIEIGPHCNDPYDCTFKGHCWKGFPEYSVFDLPGVGPKTGWKMIDQGNLKIKDLNAEDFTKTMKKAIEVTKNNKISIDKEGINKAIKDWQWPLYFLDFETLSEAIPRFEGTRPFESIPFQYSCHVWRDPNNKTLEHFEYLHTENTDPREAIAKSLVKNFGNKGSVVAWAKHVEGNALKSLAKQFPKYNKALIKLAGRLVDPMPVFKQNVYHKEFKGSFSIKYVSPALLGEQADYSQLEVTGGLVSQAIATSLMRGNITDPKQKQETIQALLEYCRQDTMGMVDLVEWLHKNS